MYSQRGYPSDMRQTGSSRQDLPPPPPKSPPSSQYQYEAYQPSHRPTSSRSYKEPSNPNPLSLRRRSQVSLRSAPSSYAQDDRSSLRPESSMSLRTSRSTGSSRRPSIAEDPYQQRSSHHQSSSSMSASRSRQSQAPNPVLERMQQNGWVGVGSANSSTTDLNDYDSQELNKRGSNDSGFGESQEDQGYFGNWSKIKKAVWGDEQNVPPVKTTSQGSHLWDRLLGATTPLSEAVAHGVARARGDEPDDDRLGEDGETKLGRAIKEYHISKATSTADLPDWLFSAAELKARSRAQSSHRSQSSYSRSRDQGQQQPQYQQNERDRYGRKGSVQDFNPYAQQQQQHSSGRERGERGERGEGRERERDTRERERGAGHQREYSETPSIQNGGGGGGSGSRAADKLRAMREAKRGTR